MVTGGNRGIGLEVCRQLGTIGFDIVLTARDQSKAQKAAKQLEGNVVAKQLDVTDRASVQSMAEWLLHTYGKLDVLINNAGILGSKPARAGDVGELRDNFETNFFGVFQLTSALLPLLEKSSDGRIINVSSGMGSRAQVANGGHAAYKLSKYALNGYTMLLAAELADRGVSVNTLCPGWVQTDMGGKNATRPVEKGAETIVWLASAEDIPTGKFLRDKKVIDW